MQPFSIFAAALVAAFVSAPAAGQTTMRCENKLVSLGESQGSIRAKCGSPQDSAYSGTTCTWGIASASCQPVMTWTYNFGEGHFLQTLVFSGDKLVAIKQGDRTN